MNRLGGRKLVASAGVLVTGLAITLARGDVPPHFGDLLVAILLAFVGGNGVEHLAAAYKGGKLSSVVPPQQIVAPAHPPVDLEPLKQQLAALQAASEAQSNTIANIGRIIVQVANGSTGT